MIQNIILLIAITIGILNIIPFTDVYTTLKYDLTDYLWNSTTLEDKLNINFSEDEYLIRTIGEGVLIEPIDTKDLVRISEEPAYETNLSV